MMSQSQQSILLGFPDTETFSDLRFHLKEIRRDLSTLTTQIEALSAAVSDEPQVIWRVRDGLASAVCGIEHDVCHHLAEALKLGGQVLEMPVLEKAGQELASLEMELFGNNESVLGSGQVNNDRLISLRTELQALASDLSAAQQEAEQVTRLQGGNPIGSEQLGRGLLQLAEVLSKRALPQSQRTHTQVVQLSRTADPDAAAEEDQWQTLATPLKEEYHPLARSLNRCPQCDATLTSEDRTFDGSYCESCRTRWSQSLES
jgi:hypothetical protein